MFKYKKLKICSEQIFEFNDLSFYFFFSKQDLDNDVFLNKILKYLFILF